MLGIEGRTALDLARLAKELRSRPLLREAVRSGRVRFRAAQIVLPVAVGDAEAEWVERAAGETVRALEKLVAETRGNPDPQLEDEWGRISIHCKPEEREVIDAGLDVAGQLLPGSRRFERLEAMAEEYLGEFPLLDDDGDPSPFDSVYPERRPEGPESKGSGRAEERCLRSLFRTSRRADDLAARASAVQRARTLTCVALRREVVAAEEGQMRAKQRLASPAPKRVASLLSAAIRSVRARVGRPIPDGTCLAVVAAHFLRVWGMPARARTVSQRVRERDGGWCTVPGCSHAATDSHHVVFRSQGGDLVDPANQTGLCEYHHHRCVHTRYLWAFGTAPDRLTWMRGGEVFRGMPE